jgi:hypothetical protein
MPIQLVALQAKLNAKLLFFKSIRHSPGFGIAPQIVRCNSGNTRCRRVWLEELPDYLLGHSLSLDLVRAIHGPKYVALRHSGRLRPGVDCNLHPGRHRNSTHAAVLADEIHDAPSTVALLNVFERKRSHLGTP